MSVHGHKRIVKSERADQPFIIRAGMPGEEWMETAEEYPVDQGRFTFIAPNGDHILTVWLERNEPGDQPKATVSYLQEWSGAGYSQPPDDYHQRKLDSFTHEVWNDK